MAKINIISKIKLHIIFKMGKNFKFSKIAGEACKSTNDKKNIFVLKTEISRIT